MRMVAGHAAAIGDRQPSKSGRVNGRTLTPMTEAPLSRQEQKEQTREALLDAALALSQEAGFAQVSLRQVAKAAGVVPTAFYRHFDSMEQVGLALVERSFATVRQLMRDAQCDPDLFTDLISSSIDILVASVKDNREHFAFVGRERLGGSAPSNSSMPTLSAAASCCSRPSLGSRLPFSIRLSWLPATPTSSPSSSSVNPCERRW